MLTVRGVVNVGLGENEKAMEWLERAFADRSNGLVFMKVEPELDSLRSNLRFVSLLQRVKLPE